MPCSIRRQRLPASGRSSSTPAGRAGASGGASWRSASARRAPPGSRRSSCCPERARLLLAAPLFLVGASVYFWCLWDFAVAGRGTPAPIDPPKQLVVRGLYRSVRNPMYLGVLLVVAGWVELFRAARVLEY